MRKIAKPNIPQEKICNSFKELKYKERILNKAKEYPTSYLQVKKLLDDETSFIEQDKEYLPYMKKMYSQRFSHKQYTDSYYYYKKIRSIEKKCPYCNYITRTVEHLDHYLPKSVFPSFALTVDNLVPICRDCNTIKDDYYSQLESETLLHPYYDKVIEEVYDFLKCKVVEDLSIGFKFYIEKLPGWDDITYNRVKKHFELLKIDDLYCSDFNADFDCCLEELKILYEVSKNIDEIYGMLRIKVMSLKKVAIKPWSYVGFKSLLENNWFFEIYLPNKLRFK